MNNAEGKTPTKSLKFLARLKARSANGPQIDDNNNIESPPHPNSYSSMHATSHSESVNVEEVRHSCGIGREDHRKDRRLRSPSGSGRSTSERQDDIQEILSPTSVALEMTALPYEYVESTVDFQTERQLNFKGSTPQPHQNHHSLRRNVQFQDEIGFGSEPYHETQKQTSHVTNRNPPGDIIHSSEKDRVSQVHDAIRSKDIEVLSFSFDKDSMSEKLARSADARKASLAIKTIKDSLGFQGHNYTPRKTIVAVTPQAPSNGRSAQGGHDGAFQGRSGTASSKSRDFSVRASVGGSGSGAGCSGERARPDVRAPLSEPKHGVRPRAHSAGPHREGGGRSNGIGEGTRGKSAGGSGGRGDKTMGSKGRSASATRPQHRPSSAHTRTPTTCTPVAHTSVHTSASLRWPQGANAATKSNCPSSAPRVSMRSDGLDSVTMSSAGTSGWSSSVTAQQLQAQVQERSLHSPTWSPTPSSPSSSQLGSATPSFIVNKVLQKTRTTPPPQFKTRLQHHETIRHSATSMPSSSSMFVPSRATPAGKVGSPGSGHGRLDFGHTFAGERCAGGERRFADDDETNEFNGWGAKFSETQFYPQEQKQSHNSTMRGNVFPPNGARNERDGAWVEGSVGRETDASISSLSSISGGSYNGFAVEGYGVVANTARPLVSPSRTQSDGAPAAPGLASLSTAKMKEIMASFKQNVRQPPLPPQPPPPALLRNTQRQDTVTASGSLGGGIDGSEADSSGCIVSHQPLSLSSSANSQGPVAMKRDWGNLIAKFQDRNNLALPSARPHHALGD